MPRRSPGPAERQRDAERTKQRIIEAAGAEFAAKGYAGARVGAIAERAGVNKQLISYYFGGKSGLYAEIGRQWREYEAAELMSGDDPAEIVRRYARTTVRQPDGARLLAWAGLTDQEQDDPDAAARSARLKENFRGVLHRADGTLPDGMDPDLFGLIILAATSVGIIYPQLVREICDMDPLSEEFAETLGDQLAVILKTVLGETPRKPDR